MHWKARSLTCTCVWRLTAAPALASTSTVYRAVAHGSIQAGYYGAIGASGSGPGLRAT
jgi:hypothetical protein